MEENKHAGKVGNELELPRLLGKMLYFVCVARIFARLSNNRKNCCGCTLIAWEVNVCISTRERPTQLYKMRVLPFSKAGGFPRVRVTTIVQGNVSSEGAPRLEAGRGGGVLPPR